MHKGLAYSERLKVLGIPTLKSWRYRRDMIETYKILHGTAVSPALTICHDFVTYKRKYLEI